MDKSLVAGILGALVLIVVILIMVIIVVEAKKPADVVCAEQLTKTSEFCKAWVEHLKLQDSKKGK